MNEELGAEKDMELDKWERWWNNLLQQEVTRRQALGGVTRLGASAFTWRTLRRLIPPWALPGLLEKIQASTGTPDSTPPTPIEPQSLPPIEQREIVHTPEPSLAEKIRIIEKVWNDHHFDELLDHAKVSVEAFGFNEKVPDREDYWGILAYFRDIRAILGKVSAEEGGSGKRTDPVFGLKGEEMRLIEEIVYPQFLPLAQENGSLPEPAISAMYQKMREGFAQKPAHELVYQAKKSGKEAYVPPWLLAGQTVRQGDVNIPSQTNNPWLIEMIVGDMNKLKGNYPGATALASIIDADPEGSGAFVHELATLSFNPHYALWGLMRKGFVLHELFGHGNPLEVFSRYRNPTRLMQETFAPERYSFWDPRILLRGFTHMNQAFMNLMAEKEKTSVADSMDADYWSEHAFTLTYKAHLKTLGREEKKAQVRGISTNEHLGQGTDSIVLTYLTDDIRNELLEQAKSKGKGEEENQSISEKAELKKDEFLIEVSKAYGNGPKQLEIHQRWIRLFPKSKTLKEAFREIYWSVYHFCLDPYLSYRCNLGCEKIGQLDSSSILGIQISDPRVRTAMAIYSAHAMPFLPYDHMPVAETTILGQMALMEQSTDSSLLGAIHDLPGCRDIGPQDLREGGEPVDDMLLLADIARISKERAIPWQFASGLPTNEQDTKYLTDTLKDKASVVAQIHRLPTDGRRVHTAYIGSLRVGIKGIYQYGLKGVDGFVGANSRDISDWITLGESIREAITQSDIFKPQELAAVMDQLRKIQFVMSRLEMSNLGQDIYTPWALGRLIARVHTQFVPYLLGYDPISHQIDVDTFTRLRTLAQEQLASAEQPEGWDDMAHITQARQQRVVEAYSEEEISHISGALFEIEMLVRQAREEWGGVVIVNSTSYIQEVLKGLLGYIKNNTPDSQPTSTYYQYMRGLVDTLSITLDPTQSQTAASLLEVTSGEQEGNRQFEIALHRLRCALAGWINPKECLFDTENEDGPMSFG